MTKSICHYATIPSEMMDIVDEHLSVNFGGNMQTSKLQGNNTDLEKRNSTNAWVPTHNWVGGLIWHYFKKANDEVFKYNIERIDGESMQYTHYGINEKYDWHQDEALAGMYRPQASTNREDHLNVQDWINTKALKIRKLSTILQLSHGDDYEGGSTQIRDVDDTLFTIPRERGTIVFFDSRMYHRAKMVKKGSRKSLICWAIGSRWE